MVDDAPRISRALRSFRLSLPLSQAGRLALEPAGFVPEQKIS
jgi:hypothetical protein